MSELIETLACWHYHSVSPNQGLRQVAGAPGVVAAQMAMATDRDFGVIRGMGFAVPDDVQPTGQVGAGLITPPAECFTAAFARAEQANG